MPKKNQVEQWALWNFDVLFGVYPTRRRCREYAAELCIGGKEDADRMFRTGAFRTSKVRVMEI